MALNSPTQDGGAASSGDPLYEAACTLYYLANKKLVEKKLNRRTDRERNRVTAAGDKENTTTAPQPPINIQPTVSPPPPQQPPPAQSNKPRSSPPSQQPIKPAQNNRPKSPPSQPPNKLAKNNKPSSPPSQPPNNKPTQNIKPRSLIIAPPSQPPKKRPRSTPSPPNKPKRARVVVTQPPVRPNGNNNHQRPPPPPPQEGGEFPPEWLKSVLGRCCALPLFKSLHNSDVKDNQNRLCMTKAHVRTYFMPLLKAEERPEEGDGVPITVFDWDGKAYKMKFRIWGDDKNHVFIGEWKNFCHDHYFETGNVVAVWMFRHLKTDLLCALITRRIENNGD